ncbi:MAG: AraC family transcriptional regulator [Flavobacteriaceae bacterium]
MKLHFIDRTCLNDSSFTAKHYLGPHFMRTWHYHPELELVLVSKGTGIRFIGDHIEKFKDNQLILLGENLPHMWRNDEKYFSNNIASSCEAHAIHFKKDFMGNHFLSAPELKHIRDMILTSRYGINFIGVQKRILDKIKGLSKLNSSEKLFELFNILDYLGKHRDIKVLSSGGYLKTFEVSFERMNKVHEYIFKNFDSLITLTEVAEVAHMNPSSFSRFFKQINKKTFNEYLNEVRVGYACRLLSENKYNITRICYESGFNNISNFNRRFKIITGRTPSQYSRKFQNV